MGSASDFSSADPSGFPTQSSSCVVVQDPLPLHVPWPIDKVNVRVLSASSSPLQELVEAQGFREDLFYRLHVYPIQIPSLDDRQEDIPFLASHFLKRYAALQNKSVNSFHEEIVDYMKMRAWPGNIRQLENLVERLVTLTNAEKKVVDRTVLPKDLSKELRKVENSNQELHVTQSLNDMLGEYEEQVPEQDRRQRSWEASPDGRWMRMSVRGAEPVLRRTCHTAPPSSPRL